MRTDRFWILVLLLVTAPVYFLTLRDEHNWGGDFAVYLQQAANLTHGEPLAKHHYAVTPRSALNHPAIYPPVPSMLLAPVYAAVGLDYRLLKATLALFWWLALPLWYLVGRRLGLEPIWSGGVLLAFGLGSLPLQLKETLGSDGVFLCLSALAIIAIFWVEDKGWTAERPALAAALVTTLLLVNYATRATAVALFAAAVVSELWRVRRLRAYGVYLLLFLGIGVVIYTKLIYDSRGQYGAQFVIDWRLYRDNFLFYLRMPASLWSASPTALRYLLAGAAIGCGLIRLAKSWWRWGLIEFYILLFWSMLTVYVVSDFRYSLPMLPPMLMLAALFLRECLPKPAALGLAALLAVAAVLNVRAMITAPPEIGPKLSNYVELTSFLSKAPADIVLLSWNPRLFAFYTQHQSAIYPRTPQEWATEIPYLEKQEHTRHFYLVVYRHELDQQQLGRYLAEAGSKLTPVFKNFDFTVYRLPE